MKVSVLTFLLLVLTSISIHPTVTFGQNIDDGYRAWLNYEKVENQELLNDYRNVLSSVVLKGNSPTMAVIKEELNIALPDLLGLEISFSDQVQNNGTLLIGTPESSSQISSLNFDEKLAQIGDEGYLIEHADLDGYRSLVITANTDIGLLYGVFGLLKQIQTHQNISEISIQSAPKVEYRMVNHWDNLSRLVERGYAGLSIWDWGTLPEYKHPRYTDYARLNASIGINATAVNNVNADPRMLSDQFLEKLVVLADIFRPYGIKVFISINYQAPISVGGLDTADPLDPNVRNWWAEKADQIYDMIPDFGGFLVKADSEGQPGPFAYDRNHAEGANVLAEALEPHGGVVIWRAFVYSPEQEDRFREAYDEFVPLDGQFKDNVILQVKNGPIDFQPREPFSPLFGAMEETNTMLELQITQEYFGFSYHLAYQGTLFEEALDSDTFANGEGSTVGKVVAGEVFDYEHTGMAGVLNIGTDRNWTGHPFVQSSWYAFGRLAWDYTLSAGEIADEWLKMTFTNKPEFLDPISEVMMISREAGVNYRSPLGLTHLYAQGHHYGPAPWTSDLPRPDWTAVYYHKADVDGIGFDRTQSGSNAIEQYHEPVRKRFNKIESTPEDYLLWFHHVDWNYEMNSGRTLWEELVHKYYEGVEQVRWMQEQWNSIEGLIDEHRFEHVKALLEIQEKDAVRWRDSCVLYFQTFSDMPIPDQYEKPEHDLEYYKSLERSLYIPSPRYD
ncbi:alpha-glucuronidase family glycosyl hydrolase [Rhodohalobacter sp. 614A]|uniref:alpha-glucuronidase family glycosyl hydrolase n=1 Tax=Rhodohalobacter sp. 614A TaxID=2908649 RepID=UPI001F2E2493|nr:alpha-glucuronidase family glycosyl hydrolase [Rhodohalobacter sp. 614A]